MRREPRKVVDGAQRCVRERKRERWKTLYMTRREKNEG